MWEPGGHGPEETPEGDAELSPYKCKGRRHETARMCAQHEEGQPKRTPGKLKHCTRGMVTVLNVLMTEHDHSQLTCSKPPINKRFNPISVGGGPI